MLRLIPLTLAFKLFVWCSQLETGLLRYELFHTNMYNVPGAAKTMKNKGHELQPSFSRFCDGKPGFWQVALKPCFQDLFIFHAQRCSPKFCGFLWMFVWIDLVGLSSYLYVVVDACSFNLSWFTSSCPSTHVHIHLTGCYHIKTLWRTEIWQQSSPTDVSQITSLLEGVL